MAVPTESLDSLVSRGVIKLNRGNVISRKHLAATPGDFPVYSSARDNNGEFGRYGLFMFDEEAITWSIDGGGNFFHRPKHKYSVTNVGGIMRIGDPAILDYRYLYFVLSDLHARNRFDWVKKAHPSIIRRIYDRIPLPPLDEQRRIVAKLDEAFAEIADLKLNRHLKLQTLADLKQSALQWFLQSDPNASGRAISRLGDLASVSTGKIDVNAAVENGQHPFFTCSREVYRIDDAPYEGKAVLVAGNGDLNVKYFEGRFNAYQRTYFLFSENEEILEPRFLYYFLESHLAALRAGAIGSTIKYIKVGDLKDAQIPLPPIDEQRRIVAKLDEVFASASAALEETEQSIVEVASLQASILTSELAAA